MSPACQFRLMSADGLPLVRDWLALPRVREWWGDPGEQFGLVSSDMTDTPDGTALLMVRNA